MLFENAHLKSQLLLSETTLAPISYGSNRLLMVFWQVAWVPLLLGTAAWILVLWAYRRIQTVEEQERETKNKVREEETKVNGFEEDAKRRNGGHRRRGLNLWERRDEE